MPLIEIFDHEHQMILEEKIALILQNERRFAVPGCPWDCEDGWHEIILSEFGPLDLIPLPSPQVVVLPHGLILVACECNVTRGSRMRRYPDWFERNA